jgi:hypothetical protein
MVIGSTGSYFTPSFFNLQNKTGFFAKENEELGFDIS